MIEKKQQPEQETSKKEQLKKMKIKVNEFGEIVKEYNTETINKFLDEHVPDKKFTEEDK